MEQRTNEWLNERMGKVTASQFYKLAAPKGLGKTGEGYIYELVANMMGVRSEEFTTYAMNWGIELEPDAIEYFQLATGKEVDKVGFCNHSEFAAGCSPDGINYEQSFGIEIKCPYNPENHVKHMTMKKATDLLEVNSNYYWQVMFSLWVTEMDTWYFASYDPRFTGKFRMTILKVNIQDEIKQFIEERVTQAIELRDKIIKTIKV